MTLVQNLRPLLSGNKLIVFLLVFSMFSCRTRKFEREQAELASEFEKQKYQEEIIDEQEEEISSTDEEDSLDKFFPRKKKKAYTIDYLFPIDFDRIYEEDFEPGPMHLATLDFYMGARLALLHNTDSSIHITANFINTANWDFSDTGMIHPSAVEGADLVIGPFGEKEVKKISVLSEEEKINMFSPFAHCQECLMNNPYFFSFKPSQNAYIDYVYRFLLSNFETYNIHLVVEDKKVADFYIQSFLEISDTSVFNSIKTHVINNVNWNNVNLANSLPEKKNVILILMENEFVINSISTNLIRAEKKEKLLIAPMQWLDIKTINLDYLHRLNTFYMTDFYFNFQDSLVQEFAKVFREEYRTEPSKYSYLGYKSTRFAIRNLSEGGVYFQRRKDYLKCVDTGDEFRKKENYAGYECCGIEMWGFEEYEFKKIPMVLPIENEEDKEGGGN